MLTHGGSGNATEAAGKRLAARTWLNRLLTRRHRTPLLPAFQSEQFAAAAQFDLIVDTAPEGAEIIGGGDDAEQHYGPHSDGCRFGEPVPADAADDQGDGDDLRGHFRFTQVAGGDGVAAG
jgi:hypothetical protein